VTRDSTRRWVRRFSARSQLTRYPLRRAEVMTIRDITMATMVGGNTVFEA
jgi:hypothetical protein